MANGDAAGSELQNATIKIDTQLCGTLPDEVVPGKWYSVKCSKVIPGTASGGLSGKQITVSSGVNKALTFCGIKVYGVSDLPLQPFGSSIDVDLKGNVYVTNAHGRIYK